MIGPIPPPATGDEESSEDWKTFWRNKYSWIVFEGPTKFSSSAGAGKITPESVMHFACWKCSICHAKSGCIIRRLGSRQGDAHQESNAHRKKVLDSNALLNDEGRVLRVRLEGTKLERFNLINAAVWLAKECIAMAKFPRFCAVLNSVFGVPLPKDSRGEQLRLHSAPVGRGFLIAAAVAIRRKLVKKMNESAFYSVSLDESDDVSNHSTMAIIGTYLDNEGVPVTSFMGLVRVLDRTAAGLKALLLQKCVEFELDVRRLVGLGTDGASVMEHAYTP
jgi:hypothetical protein